jgi:hypothetical protein
MLGCTERATVCPKNKNGCYSFCVFLDSDVLLGQGNTAARESFLIRYEIAHINMSTGSMLVEAADSVVANDGPGRLRDVGSSSGAVGRSGRGLRFHHAPAWL